MYVSYKEGSVCVELIGEKVKRTVQFIGLTPNTKFQRSQLNNFLLKCGETNITYQLRVYVVKYSFISCVLCCKLILEIVTANEYRSMEAEKPLLDFENRRCFCTFNLYGKVCLPPPKRI
jgi:hypothetical protein